MTPQELRTKRLASILNYKDNYLSWAWDDTEIPSTDELLDTLESLDEEYAAAQSAPYYAFVNHAENLWNTVKLCEGQAADMHAPIDALVSHLIRYKANLPHGETE